MSGDLGPHVAVSASLRCVSQFPNLHLTLVGQSQLLESLLAQRSALNHPRIQIHAATEVVAMDDPLAQALRGKPDSSMRIALKLVALEQAQACVSAGNSAALMALSRYLLNTIQGIDRPAMVSAFPTQQGLCYLLDLGANVECTAEQLAQFALMGSMMAQLLGVQKPRVALLNVGVEHIKGTQQVKTAAALLQQDSRIHYTGYVEGDGLYRGDADVVVCDGFTGNVLLKASEGLVAMLGVRAQSLAAKSARTKLLGLLAKPFMKNLYQDLAAQTLNGASLIGLQGIVVKTHGASNQYDFAQAIKLAMLASSQNLSQRLSTAVQAHGLEV